MWRESQPWQLLKLCRAARWISAAFLTNIYTHYELSNRSLEWYQYARSLLSQSRRNISVRMCLVIRVTMDPDRQTEED